MKHKETDQVDKETAGGKHKKYITISVTQRTFVQFNWRFSNVKRILYGEW